MEKPSYLKDSDDARLFNELRKKVNQRVEAIPENRDIYIKIKAVILPLIYLGLYFFAVFNCRKILAVYTQFCSDGNLSGFNLFKSDPRSSP